MKNAILILFVLSITLTVKGQNAFLNDKNSVLGVMKQQELCWNKGDIECFMQGYWKSDSLKFIGKKGITYGWNQTLENYRKSYPNRQAMGKLSFNILTIEQLSEDILFLLGQWTLDYETDTITGHYSLIWKKIDSEWLIIADHSS